MKVFVYGATSGPVCRNWQAIYRVLDRVLERYPDLEVVHMGCAGVASFARLWATERKVPHVEVQWVDEVIAGGTGGAVEIGDGLEVDHARRKMDLAGVKVWRLS